MDTQTAGYQNKLLGAFAQTDYTGGFVCLRRRLIFSVLFFFSLEGDTLKSYKS